MTRETLLVTLIGGAILPALSAEEPSREVDYARVQEIFGRYCTGCHNDEDRDGGLVLETPAGVRAGGENGPILVPGQSGQSKLVLVLERKLEPFMPPGKRRRPTAVDLALLKSWIDAGAVFAGAAPARPRAALETPRIPPAVPPRRAIHAVAWLPGGDRVALARHGEVELVSGVRRLPAGRLTLQTGSVNALAPSRDGAWLVAAAGEPGVFGEAWLWDVARNSLVRAFRGHGDSLYAVALSGDRRVLATGSYDRKVILWSTDTGQPLRTLSGHNGAIFDLAFRPDGGILASASADRTVKLWSVATGKRLDTLSHSLDEVHAVTFSPGGQRVAAGGVDRRIRVWRVSESGEEGANAILHTRFAHEGPIIGLVYSPDGRRLVSSSEDRTVKLWEAETVRERVLLERQPDWPGALDFSPDGRTLVVGRLDGSVGFYEVDTAREIRVARRSPGTALLIAAGAALATAGEIAAGKDDGDTGKSAKKPARPELRWPEPRGIRRAAATRVRLVGKNLNGLTALRLHRQGVEGKLLPAAAAGDDGEAWIELTAAVTGPCELSVVSAAGESNRVTLHVDTLPQISERKTKDGHGGAEGATAGDLPCSFWGVIESRGDVDDFRFQARAGETLVLDIAARRLGSRADLVLSVLDRRGRVLASRNDFDGSPDPLLAFPVPADGTYTARLRDLTLGASRDHYYRLSAGAFPYVTGCYPLGVPAGKESTITLVGHNLPEDAAARVGAADPGEVEIRFDTDRLRSRRSFRAVVTAGAVVLETEPNNRPGEAQAVDAPVVVNGRIEAPRAGGDADADLGDRDLYRFRARAGERWIIETDGARRGSPVDTRIEVLDVDGHPVERVLLQAVRDSNITFRPIDSSAREVRVENWEEMELNEYVYFQGEVARIFRMPRGPDSGIQLYPSNGRRRCYFDTSATNHPNLEPCYIVVPHAPGTKLVPTGLPTFTLHYENDDDGERKLESDSRLTFTAPAAGEYLIRVSDVRGFGGERHAYRLMVRRPRPDFRVRIDAVGPTINAGSGRRFTVRADRRDGFEDAIRVDIDDLPTGFSASTPLVIEAGHIEASGTLNAAPDAPPPSREACEKVRVTATATIGGQDVTREVNHFGQIQLGEEPPLFVKLLPAGGSSGAPGRPAEITLAPGETVRARIQVERNGHEGRVTFEVPNLPHGVIVDNIGLNGVLIPPGENEREVFLRAAGWVPETSRLAFARSNEAGGQTSLPVLLHVERSGDER